MAKISPRIRVAYTNDATVVAFADERILEETDVRAIREALGAIIEQADQMNLVLDFGNVRFLSIKTPSAYTGFCHRPPTVENRSG